MTSQQPKIVLVSGGDAKYFDMLHELATSIRALPESQNVDVVFLDGGGFEQTHIDAFSELNVSLLDPKWPNPQIQKRCANKEYLKINLAKPALNTLFPSYDIIIWIDGDAWLQNWKAIDLAVMVAQKGKLAVVSQNTRFRSLRFNFKKKLFGWADIRTIFHKNAKRARLGEYAWKLANLAVLNAGFYALRQDAPHWATWTAWRDKSIKKGRPFTSDQLSLALTCYIDNFPFETLPEICNYMGPWRVDENNRFVEIFAPYAEASVIHMAGLDKWREDPKQYISMVQADDTKKLCPIRYCEWIKTQKNINTEQAKKAV